MSEKYFLEKCIIFAGDVKGFYAELSHMDLEQKIKQMYSKMDNDLTNHLTKLNDRLIFLTKTEKCNIDDKT